MIFIFISLLFYILCLYSIEKKGFYYVFFLVSSIAYFGLFTLLYISHYYTGQGFNESILFHISYGLGGSTMKEDLIFFILGSSFSFLSAISPIILYVICKNSKRLYNSGKYGLFSIIFLLFAFITHPVVVDSYKMYNISFFVKQSHFDIKKIYQIPEPPKIEDNKQKNIVFIYLESFENIYLNEEIFPGLAPELNKLKKQSISFSNIDQSYGSSWTIGGMVGSQCGLPLLTNGEVNDSHNGPFLEKAYCIGDYLKQAGYNLNYIGGADHSFAGKGSFYKTHGFDTIVGKNELKGLLDDSKYIHKWGLYDDSLLSFAKESYDDLSNTNNPFGLFLLTLDTHGKQGTVSQSCKTESNSYESGSILNSYHCSDRLVSQFVEEIKNSDQGKNTLIVLVSDHYAMGNNNSYDILEKHQNQRSMLFMMIDPSINESMNITKKGSTLDIGPTVLAQLGFNIKRFGLGVNLLSQEQSLKVAYPEFVFQEWLGFYKSFW